VRATSQLKRYSYLRVWDKKGKRQGNDVRSIQVSRQVVTRAREKIYTVGGIVKFPRDAENRVRSADSVGYYHAEGTYCIGRSRHF
jgi:hypothetical protein